MKRMAALCAVGMSVLFANPAWAASVSGYVCSATYTRQPNTFFGQGWVSVRLYSGPQCTGNDLGTYYYLGSGASNVGFQHTEAERLQLYEQALEAARQGNRAQLALDTVNNSAILITTYSVN